MPRIAFAGNVVLHEPTIGSEIWWMDYGRDAAYTDKGRVLTYFFMLANANDVVFLNSLTKQKQIMDAVVEWQRSCTATESELWRALMWVKCGAEDIQVEENEKISDALADEQTRDMLWSILIATSGACGISPEQLETRTRSELDAMLYRANIQAHIPMRPSVANDYIAYRQILRQIEDRGNGEQQS